MTEWTTEPISMPTREEREFFMNGGAQADLELAFRDGEVIDYTKQAIGKGHRDLEIKIVLRHKSAILAGEG